MMKYVKCLSIILTMILAAGTSSWADNLIAIDGAEAGPDVARMSLLGRSAETIHLRVAVGGFRVDGVSTEAGSFARLDFESGYHTLPTGLPRLPAIHEFIEIPAGASADAVLVDSTYVEYELKDLGILSPIMPVQPPLEKTREAVENYRFVIDRKAYETGGWYPVELVTVGEPVQMRNHHMVSLAVHPIQYDPAARRIRCYTDVRIDLVHQGGKKPTDQRYVSPSFERMAAGIILNYTPPETLYPTLDVGYLIIANDSFVSAVQPLADWKAQKGFTVTLADQGDMTWTASGIAAYIQTAYDTWPVPPTGVLLVGDTDYLPAHSADAYSGVTDLDYQCVAGSDDYPDIHCSRMPARNTADVTAMVNKVLDYERVENLGTGWFDQAVFIASSDMDAFAEDTHNHVIADNFEPAGVTCHTIYERLGGSTADITSNINAGREVCIYSGHGATTGWGCVPFSISNVDALTNTGMYPFVNSHACVTGDFEQTECFAEAWVKRANKGAIAFWGSVPSTYWDEDDWLERDAWDHHFDDDMRTFGELTDQAEIDLDGHGTSLGEYYREGYNLFNDWSVALWTDDPASLTVTHPASIPMGSSNASVTVRIGLSPVENALVCIRQPAGFQAAAYTDASGTALVPCSPATTDTCDITVTGYNLDPYEGTILVGVSGPYIVYESHALDDDNSGASSGNGDGTANPGEIIELALDLRNFGDDTGYGVSATIDSADAYVDIIDATAAYGDIAPDATAANLDALVFEVLSSCPDGHDIAFTVTATDGSDSWESYFSVPVSGAQLEYFGHSVSDTPLGNNDGDADPGETVYLQVTLENTGLVDASGVSATVTHDQPGWVTLLDDAAGYPDITIGGTGTSQSPHYRFALDYDTPCGLSITFTIDVATNEGGCSDTFTVLVGGTGVGFSDDMESGTGSWTHGGTNDTWSLITDGGAHSPTHDWFGEAVGAMSDQYLYTPEVSITALSELSFWHDYDVEDNWDGCVIEISTDGGSTWQDLGPYITQNPYNGTLYTGYSCPLEGREAWTEGSPSAMEEVLVDLSGFDGAMATIRFRIATDDWTTAYDGWYVDDVQITGAECQPYSGGVTDTVSCTYTCSPSSGTVPFSSTMWVGLTNLDMQRPATRVSARIGVQLANGASYGNWKSGTLNITLGDTYSTGWSQYFPASGAVLGANVFTLTATDVTPAPYNQPPYAPDGDTDTDQCVVTAGAP